MKKPLEEIRELQLESAELEIKKNRLQGDIYGVMKRQSEISVRLNEIVLEAQKNSKEGLFVPDANSFDLGAATSKNKKNLMN